MSQAISVVIPMFNEARHITRTLQAVRAAAERAGCEWEVIVVDNGSSDDGPRIARELGARVLDCPRLSIAALRNRGAAASRHAWLAFLDADMQVPESWLLRRRARTGPSAATASALVRPRLAAQGGRRA